MYLSFNSCVDRWTENVRNGTSVMFSEIKNVRERTELTSGEISGSKISKNVHKNSITIFGKDCFLDKNDKKA